MGSMEDLEVTADPTKNVSGAEDNDFRSRVYQREKWTIPRRYVIAIMLSLALLIDAWKNSNATYMLYHELRLEADAHIYYPTISNWTWEEVQTFQYASLVGNICIQFPGALLIFITSSHKYLYTSVAISSILHMLTPVFVNHHAILFVVVHISQKIISAPIRIAVLSMWKDWAPSTERTKLMTLSFGGAYLVSASEPVFQYMLDHSIISQSFYFTGACGLLWSLFWYVRISDTPSNDPKISESELLYLQNSIPPTLNNTPKFSQIPWKSILTSKPVYALFLIYYKTSSCLFIITAALLFIYYYVSFYYENYYPLTPIWILILIGVLIASSIAADVLVKKYRGHVLMVRKSFICGAFSVHAFLLLFLLFLNSVANMVFYVLAYAVLSISVAGFCTIALDLSSRYVTIIGGMIETYYALGQFVTAFITDEVLVDWEINRLKWIILHEFIVAILAVGIFIKWGSVEEQPWSFNLAFGRPSTNCQSYPKPEDENVIKLVPDNL